MNIITKVREWGNRHHPAALGIVRVALGLFLLLKGYAFLQNMAYLKWMILSQESINIPPSAVSFIIFYVVFFHMTGGTLIILGILTRLAALLQLPIIIAAIFFINIFKSPLNTELWLSVLIGILLLLFLLTGSGPVSLDNYLTKSKKE